jgi:aconitate decarboxylase
VSVTGDLCQRIVATRRSDLGREVMTAAARLVLDGLAVAIAGAREPAIALLLEHHRGQGTAPAATVLGAGADAKLGPVSAAAVNGAAMHVLDFEPMWSPANHALSTTLPAVLALAERTAAPGAEVLTALVKGVEVQGWIRHASRQWAAEELTFHPPGVVGPIGAAVAAAHLLRLGPHELACAIGIAASRSGGLMANIGTMTKSLHCGQAAAAGLEAALLAARGFTASTEIFDDPRGLPAAFSPGFVSADLARFGPPFRIVEPGYVLKLFPCQYGTHFGITAALALRRQIPDPAAISAVRLHAPLMRYVDRPRPDSGLAGKFSLQYTLAAALLDGAVDRATFTDERLHRPALSGLLSKVELLMSPDIPARFEDMHVVVEVDLTDGRTLRERCEGPPGIWGSAPISAAEHLAKVVDCCRPSLDAARTERLVELTEALPRLPGAGVGQLLELAGGGVAAA